MPPVNAVSESGIETDDVVVAAASSAAATWLTKYSRPVTSIETRSA